MFGNFKISNEEYISALTEINGIAPENWFVAINKGKDRKINRGFLVNNTEETIQLIPIKKENKTYIIDKENVITLSITEDIKKCVLVIEDTHDHFYIYLNNGAKIKTVVRKKQFDKNRKATYKAFRKQFKKHSAVQQTFDIGFTTLVVWCVVVSVLFELNNYNPIAHIYMSNQLKSLVEDEANAEYLDIVLEPYDKADLELEENYITVKHGNIKMNIPSNLYVDSELSNSEDSITYTNGLTKNLMTRVNLEYEPLDFSGFVNDDGDEKETKAYYEKISPIIEKEFGFPITNMYQYQKAIWAADVDNINYWNYKETVIYYTLANTKLLTAPGDCQHVYDIKTDTYSGFILEVGPTPIDIYLISFWVYPNSNPDLQYVVQVISGDITEAYKILNSVELVTE